MFEIKIDNAKYWKDCVSAIVSLVDEGLFNITKEGISLKAMDPSSISMISFNMPNKSFSKFNVDKPVSIGLNIGNLDKMLSRTREGESLVMKDSENKLLLEFIGPNGRRKYRIQLIDVKKSVEKEPNVDFDSHVTINGEPFKDIIKDASMLSSYISFNASKGLFSARARGDSGELEEFHENDSGILKKLESKKEAESTFNLEFLENMIKACPPGNEIDISLKSNEPMKLWYNIGDAQVSYFLAPYMEE